MIRTLLFDVDGTLYDETHAKAKAELLTAEFISCRSHLDLDTVFAAFREAKARVLTLHKGLSKRNDRRLWYEDLLDCLEVSDLTAKEAADFYWETVCGSIEPYFDLKYVIKELAERYRLVILTDELREIQKRKLRRLELEDYFDMLISSDQVGETKPSQKLYKYALDLIGETEESILMIGDNPRADIKGGNTAGLHTAWLKRGKYHYYPLSDLETPDMIFTNYIQLEKKIDALCAGEPG